MHAEDREVELDSDKVQRMLNKEEKDEAQGDAKEEMLEPEEINEFSDNFIGAQHMNAFDLLLPTMEHQLRSGIKGVS